MTSGKSTDSPNKMQYNNFSKKVVSASSFFVTPERPTDSATKLLSRRVYYQIMTRIVKAHGMPAMDWGWDLQDNQSSLLCRRWTSLQTFSWRSFIATTASIPARHYAALVEKMDYYAFLPVNLAKLQNVTIRTTRFLWSSMAMKMTKE